MGQKAKLNPQYAAGLRDAIAMLDKGEADYELCRERLLAADIEPADAVGFAAEIIRVEKAEIQFYLDLAEKLGRKPSDADIKAARMPVKETLADETAGA
jgi:hypothetical protein